MSVKFSDLKGKTLSNVENRDNEKIVFTTKEGEKFKLCPHEDMGCGDEVLVMVEDICGDLSSLIGSEILLAEEVTQGQNIGPDPPSGYSPEGSIWTDQDQTSFRWTFYKLRTMKGDVTIRWYGCSNGYYSESVDFERM